VIRVKDEQEYMTDVNRIFVMAEPTHVDVGAATTAFTAGTDVSATPLARPPSPPHPS
jgi:hypothetical protein